MGRSPVLTTPAQELSLPEDFNRAKSDVLDEPDIARFIVVWVELFKCWPSVSK